MPMINYAHRGASEYYPENTLRSFNAGLDMEADGIETDIQRTRDGVLVLHHDDTLERIPHVAGSVKDYTYDELLQMDFGAFKGTRFAGERIVKLDTFLTHFAHRGLTLALEIKQHGIESDCLRIIINHNCRDEVIFTFFIWNSVTALRELDADIMLGYLTGASLVRRRVFSIASSYTIYQGGDDMYSTRYRVICLLIFILGVGSVILCIRHDNQYQYSSYIGGRKTCRMVGCGRSALYPEWGRRFCSQHMEGKKYCHFGSCNNKIPHNSKEIYCSGCRSYNKLLSVK